jgi:hypothetical protein
MPPPTATTGMPTPSTTRGDRQGEQHEAVAEHGEAPPSTTTCYRHGEQRSRPSPSTPRWPPRPEPMERLQQGDAHWPLLSLSP